MSTESERAAAANRQAYDDYYHKPAWWFRWRYDTQVKRKVCLALALRLRRDWSQAAIFELGFGSGATLLSFPSSCRLSGIEISPSAHSHLRAEAARRGFAEPQLAHPPASGPLPFAAASQDLIVASHVLEHVPDDNACLCELHRLLKPGGGLVVLVPINERHADPNHLRHFTTDSCRAAAEQAGFATVWTEENEWLYYLVENLYWRHVGRRWSPPAAAARVAFNLLTAPLPLALCRLGDRLVAAATGLPARQAALLFRKPTG